MMTITKNSMDSNLKNGKMQVEGTDKIYRWYLLLRSK